MPGVYLAAIALPLLAIGAIDARWRLALFRAPRRSLAAVATGVVFFLAWDGVGIASGSFQKGTSDLYVGVDLAPHLPLEEVFFLTFLCYLALVLFAGALRLLDARARARTRERA